MRAIVERSESGAAVFAGCFLVLVALVVATAVARTSAAGEPERAPAPAARADVMFVLDNSGSMRAHDPARATAALLAEFAEALPRGSRLGVVLFDDSARVLQPLSRDVGPGTTGGWNERLRALDYRGRLTNSPAGIERALYELAREGREDAARLIVFVTDGLVDTGDRARDVEKTRWLKQELAAEARRAGVRIYGVAFTATADVELIQALALATDGAYFRVDRPDAIAGVLASVSLALRAPPARGGETAAREPVPAAVAGAPPAPVAGALPAVASASPGRTPGLVLLSIGLVLGAAVVVAPWLERRRRRVRMPSSAFVDAAAARIAAAVLPAMPRDGRPPVVELVEFGDDGEPGRNVLLLERSSNRIGRDPGGEVTLAHETVSSLHATVDYRDGYFQLEDQRSTNGTFLNGRRLAPSRAVRLKSGDRIGIASRELLFLIPDHAPRGRTQPLVATSLPPSPPGARPDHDAAGGGRAGAADAHASADGLARAVADFDRGLAAHLERIAALGDAARRFVGRAFPVEVRARLVRSAQDLIEHGQRERAGAQLDVGGGAIHYTLCAVPGPLERARDWYTARSGGYAKFLVGLLDARTRAADDFEAVVVITFGLDGPPWISVTIVPARDDAEAVEVMSYEFLSEDERRRALDLEITGVARVR